MQRERDGKADFAEPERRGFSGMESHRGMMTSIFGRDPFDDPFFNRPFSAFGSNIFDSHNGGNDLPVASSSKGPIIEELIDTDDEGAVEEEGNNIGSGVREDKARGSSKDPLIEYPEDQEVKSKDVSHGVNYDRVEGTQPHARSVSFRKVTYGGINGAYYTATTTRKMGSDGVVLEESKQADRTTGQAAHRISRGIHDKGHSVTRQLDKDGKVDTMQTLHNLEEDELAGFEKAWNGNVLRHLPRWNEESHSFETAGAAMRFGTHFRSSGGVEHGNDSRTVSSAGRPKKVITINIE